MSAQKQILAPRRWAAGIEYDGSVFCGWQRQKHQAATVQAHVEKALSFVANHGIKVVCAGRTDTGVHGVGQVIHFDSSEVRAPHNWVLGANANLPDAVSVRWATEVPMEFHARFSAQWRRYLYIIANTRSRPALMRNQVTWFHRPLNAELMQAAADSLVGRHDFNAFRAVACQSKSSIRTIHYCHVRRQGAAVIVDIKANAFLYHMVRNVVGSLLAVGTGDQSVAWFKAVLDGCQREAGGITAKPNGLHFVEVGYPSSFGLPAPSGSFPMQWLDGVLNE